MLNPSRIPVTDRDKSTAMDLFGDLFLLSFMWLVCGALIVTIPVACIALYDAVAHCVVGGEKEPVKRFWFTAKRELIRVVRKTDGEVSLDFGGKMNGRGAYICPNPECLKKAQRSKALERSLEVEIPAEVYERLTKEIEVESHG